MTRQKSDSRDVVVAHTARHTTAMDVYRSFVQLHFSFQTCRSVSGYQEFHFKCDSHLTTCSAQPTPPIHFSRSSTTLHRRIEIDFISLASHQNLHDRVVFLRRRNFHSPICVDLKPTDKILYGYLRVLQSSSSTWKRFFFFTLLFRRDCREIFQLIYFCRS